MNAQDEQTRGAQLPGEYHEMPTEAQFESTMGPVDHWRRWYQDPVRSKAAGPEAVAYVSGEVADAVNKTLDKIGSSETRITAANIDQRSVWHKLNERLLQEQASEYMMFPSLGDCGNQDDVQEHLHRTVYIPIFNEVYQDMIAAYLGRGAYNRRAFYNPAPINLGRRGLTVAEYVTRPNTMDCHSDFNIPRVHVPGLGI